MTRLTEDELWPSTGRGFFQASQWLSDGSLVVDQKGHISIVVHRCDLLEQFKRRGLQQVDLLITDGNQAMLNAIEQKFPTAQRQRCVVHKLKNVLGYIPKERQAQLEPELKAIFYQESRAQADQALAAFCAKYEKHYPTAVACLRRDSDACLTFYHFPQAHWKTIRTNNISERLFEEVKKRYHKMNAAFSHRRQLSADVLCRHSFAQIQTHPDACLMLSFFTHNLSYCQTNFTNKISRQPPTAPVAPSARP